MLKDIDAKTLNAWLKAGKAVLIDVREVDEYAREHIVGSRLVPLSAFDKADFRQDKDKVAVFHCRTGNRTRIAAAQLLETGFADVYHLEGGIEAWKAAGLPVHYDATQPFSIMRQVQLIAGSLVITGAVLALVVSPWFALLSAFVGGGLLVASATGVCPMAGMLAKLPFNRRAMTPMGDTTGHVAANA